MSMYPRTKRGKLDSKTKKCTLPGYGSMQKGYQMFDRLTHKVLYSRNVKFEEHEMERPPVEEEKSTRHPLVLDPFEASASDDKGDDKGDEDASEDTR